ncbi:MAG: hypothetical protein HQK54_12660 [Oligoflexales bacterium]|nr:hypothetical protein [Oligoflexales bacterium]
MIRSIILVIPMILFCISCNKGGSSDDKGGNNSPTPTVKPGSGKIREGDTAGSGTLDRETAIGNDTRGNQNGAGSTQNGYNSYNGNGINGNPNYNVNNPYNPYDTTVNGTQNPALNAGGGLEGSWNLVNISCSGGAALLQGGNEFNQMLQNGRIRIATVYRGANDPSSSFMMSISLAGVFSCNVSQSFKITYTGNNTAQFDNTAPLSSNCPNSAGSNVDHSMVQFQRSGNSLTLMQAGAAGSGSTFTGNKPACPQGIEAISHYQLQF